MGCKEACKKLITPDICDKVWPVPTGIIGIIIGGGSNVAPHACCASAILVAQHACELDCTAYGGMNPLDYINKTLNWCGIPKTIQTIGGLNSGIGGAIKGGDFKTALDGLSDLIKGELEKDKALKEGEEP
jgi:hypothetical protein